MTENAPAAVAADLGKCKAKQLVPVRSGSMTPRSTCNRGLVMLNHSGSIGGMKIAVINCVGSWAAYGVYKRQVLDKVSHIIWCYFVFAVCAVAAAGVGSMPIGMSTSVASSAASSIGHWPRTPSWRCTKLSWNNMTW